MKTRLFWMVFAVAFSTLLVACGSDSDSGSADVAVSLTAIGRHAENQVLDEGRAEIVSFHVPSQSILLINAQEETVDVLDASTLTGDALASPLTASNLLRRQQIDVGTDVTAIPVGGVNSVAVKDELIAVAVENDDKQANGVIAFYRINAQGQATFLKAVAAGALPDNVIFTPDGLFALAANEGEPSADYTNDPEGSVTIVPIANGQPADVGSQVFFAAADIDDKVRISHPDASVGQDLEPEYIAASADSSKAYVSLQENNAIAVVDIATATVERVFGLTVKDHGKTGNGLDASNRDDKINIQTYAGVFGLPMPDTIASFSKDGSNYLVTANEGDAREYFFDTADEADCLAAGGLDYDPDDGCLSWIDEARVNDLALDSEAFPAADLQNDERLGRLKTIVTQGDTDNDGDNDKIFSYGTRSFSIWNADTGALVYDSGDAFEQITATQLGFAGFNSTDDENAPDDRSDDKGPEPEALAIGEVGGRMYAFIGLERTGGIMVYDITNPQSPVFQDFTFNRDVTVDIATNLSAAGDLSPEGMAFVTAADSPTGKALLIVGHEVSGTTTVYQIQ